MAPAAKKAKYDSAVDEVISTVRRSYFGKPVDDEFLNFLKSLLENKMASSEGHSTLFDYQLLTCSRHRSLQNIRILQFFVVYKILFYSRSKVGQSIEIP